jgi:hypothetical protein
MILDFKSHMKYNPGGTGKNFQKKNIVSIKNF